MTEKQYRKADSMVFTALMIVMVGILLNVLGFVSTQGGSSKLTLTLVVSILGIVINTALFFVYRGKRICGVCMLFVTCVVYNVMVVNVDFLLFYLLAAVIFICEMAYLENRRIIIGVLLTMPIFTIKTVWLMNQGLVSSTEGGTAIVICLVMFASVVLITRLLVQFNQENMASLKTGNDRMVKVSESIVTNFDKANESIRELSHAVDSGNVFMQNIADSIENTSQAIEEQSQMCHDIESSTMNAKEQTRVMVEASFRTLENVTDGAKAMEELNSHAQIVAKENMETVAYVEALNDRTKQVVSILSTISNISFQTNILALNASVEAARAGDAGRGFAVVADEIRALAEKTQQATDNISDILGELSNDVDSVTTSINRSVGEVGEQNRLIEETKTKFDEMNTSVSELMEVINRLKEEIEGIADATAVIADGITGVSANSQEVAAASSEGADLMEIAAEDMSNVNALLTNIYNQAQHLK
ncbi:MAG: hypothetical protein IJ324_11160 [Lachnospiraceae bacterium]|nr:hypothetical protein [Lachnospiraceae bacterium]